MDDDYNKSAHGSHNIMHLAGILSHMQGQILLEFKPHPSLSERNPTKWTWLNRLDPLGKSTLVSCVGK